jgi:hypothetical protein
MKKIFLLTVCIIVFVGTYYASSFLPFNKTNRFKPHISDNNEIQRLQSFAAEAKLFTADNGYNTSFCFLLDMRLPSGQNRFFVYDLKNNQILYAGLVAHGSCNTSFLTKAQFSNQPGCGCSAKGKYKVGYKYAGRFGTAYKLYGLDSTNSNAYNRYIVLHSYYLVPDKETAPMPICNSLGCAMVSPNFIKQLAVKIDASKKPVLLWMFE